MKTDISQSQRERLISHEEAARRISEGVWTVSDGHLFSAHAWATATATAASGALVVVLGGQQTFSLAEKWILALDDGRIVVIHVHTVSKPRKKREGGGMYDVPQLGTFLVLSRHEAERVSV